MNPSDALKRLLEGNARFVRGRASHPNETASWRERLEAGQRPFAVILGCSDSRVPPELLFDQGFGDLFVVRVAGAVVGTSVAASIEYAVDHLGTALVVVLGHTGCGAVAAALDETTAGEAADEVVSLLTRIEPALADVPADLREDERLSEAIRNNVRLSCQRLSDTPDLRRSVEAERLRIVGALYDMRTGRVGVLE